MISMNLSITYSFLFISVMMDSYTGQWWSTEQCWDHWREWSLFWLKTLEANGERVLIMIQSRMHLTGCCDTELAAWLFIFLFSPHAGHCGYPQLRSWSFLWGATASHTANRSVWNGTLAFAFFLLFFFFWLCRSRSWCKQLSADKILKEVLFSLRWSGSSMRLASRLILMMIREQP